MNSIILLLLLGLKGFEASSSFSVSGNKRIRYFQEEDESKTDNTNEFVPKKIPRKPFQFNFLDESKVVRGYTEPSREDALKIFIRCDKRKINELLENNYEFYGNGIWAELIQKKKYAAIKYMLSNYYFEKIVHEKVFEEAIETGSTALAIFLLKRFKPALLDDASKAFKAAIKFCRYKILRALRSANFDVNIHVDIRNKRSPLHLAVMMNDLQSVKLLLKFKNITVNAEDRQGNTSIHLCKSVEVLDCLLISGADLTILNHKHLLPVNMMAKNSLYDLVAHLEPSVKRRLSSFIRSCRDENYSSALRTFVISRQHVLEDSFYLASRESKWYTRESEFNINFDGESGVDRGGLSREWMSLLIERLVVPRLRDAEAVIPESDESTENDNDNVNWYYEDDDDEDDGRIVSFVSSDEDDHYNRFPSSPVLMRSHLARVPSSARATYYGAPFECVDTDNKMYKISPKFAGPTGVYKFIGSIVAKALLCNTPLKIKLVPSLFSLILDHDLSFQDLEEDDPAMHRSMLHVLSDNFDFGAVAYELPSTGELVTRENADLLLSETAFECMYNRQKAKIDQFVEGFQSIISPQMLNGYFNVLELQEILYGSDEVDRSALPAAIKVAGMVWKAKEQMFWDAVALLSDEELVQLIRFITGTNGLPYGGITNLSQEIRVYDGIDQLFPHASTCNYSMNLPVQYESTEEVLEGFRLAIASEPEFIDGVCYC